MNSRALVVDDEPDWRTVFGEVLDVIGLRVDAVAGVADARALLLENEYALVLLDAVLDATRGTLDSQILLDTLRTKYPWLPVVATTGKLLKPPEVLTLAKLGVVDLVYKPEIRLHDLRGLLRQVVESQQASREASQAVPAGGAHHHHHHHHHHFLPGDRLPRTRHATVLVVDAVRFSRHGILVQVAWRDGLRVIVGEAARRAGIPENAIQLQSRGDGFLGVIGAEVPKMTIVADLVRELRIALQACNRARKGTGGIRLRMALHQGEVSPTCGTWFAGDAAVVAARLVDAPAVRRLLDESPAVELALIVSAELFGFAVSEHFGGFDPGAFCKVDVDVPTFTGVAWVTAPGLAAPSMAEHAAGMDPHPPAASSAEPQDAAGWDFLVSAAEEDESWGAWIAWQLEQRGYRVHLETWERQAGDHKVGRLDDALTHSTRTLVILSDNYLRSEAARAEWHAAWLADPDGMQHKLIPIRVAECNPAGLLGGITFIDLVGTTDTEAEAKLVEQIERSVASRYRPDSSPPFPGTREP